MSSEFDKRVEEFFRTYQDRGMKKWAGAAQKRYCLRQKEDDESERYQGHVNAVFW